MTIKVGGKNVFGPRPPEFTKQEVEALLNMLKTASINVSDIQISYATILKVQAIYEFIRDNPPKED